MAVPVSHQVDSARPPTRRTNALAVVALCCALLGLVTCVTGPIGAVLGQVARRQALRRQERGATVALAAVVVGWTGFALMLVTATAVVVYVATSPDTVPAHVHHHHHHHFG